MKGEGRFGQEVRDAVVHSRLEALRLGCNYIDSHHLFLGILHAERSSAIEALGALQVDRAELKEKIDAQCRIGQPIESNQNMPLTVVAEHALKGAYREVAAMRSTTIDAVHLMLSILHIKDSGVALLMSRQWGIGHEGIQTIPGIPYSRIRWWLSRYAPWW
jgi:ATP-dependent Clp protease ATP-binding subunit ClpC